MQRQTPVRPLGVSVLRIAHNRMSAVSQVDADLVLSARHQFHVQQGQVLCLLEHGIRRMRQSSLRGIGRGVDAVRAVLRQLGLNRLRGLLAPAVHDSQIPLLRFVPSPLQAELCLDGLRKDEDPRGLPVQAVDDEDAVPAGRLIHHENIPVFVKDLQPSRQKSGVVCRVHAFTEGAVASTNCPTWAQKSRRSATSRKTERRLSPRTITGGGPPAHRGAFDGA